MPNFRYFIATVAYNLSHKSHIVRRDAEGYSLAPLHARKGLDGLINFEVDAHG